MISFPAIRLRFRAWILSVGLLVGVATGHAQDYNTSKPNISGPYNFSVNSFTGNLHVGRQDIRIPGRGLDIDLTFSYNSLHRLRNFGFGHGWSFAYSMGIETDSIGVWLRRRDGKRDLFRQQGNDLVAPTGVFDVLEQTSPGMFRLTAKNGTQYHFEEPTHKRLTRIQDRYGNAIQLTYTDSLLTGMEDATGRSAVLTYSDGLLTGIVTGTTPERSVSYAYNAQGDLVKVTDALGQDLFYVYDDAHRIIGFSDRNANPLSIGYDGNGAAIRMASCMSEIKIHYDQGNRKTHVSEEVEGEHQLTTYTYNALNRLVKQEGNCCGYNTRFEYDNAGNIIKRTNGNGASTQYSYDAKGNLLQEIDPMGNASIYTYEAVFNQVASITDRKGNTTSFTYDGNGNLTGIARPLGVTESFTYDGFGQRTSHTDGNGNVYQYAYDSHGYLLSITDPEGGVLAMTYDGVGNQLTRTTPNGHTTQYAYDALDRLTSGTDPLGHVTALTYDAKANVVQVTDALGRVTEYGYDPLDRIAFKIDALDHTTLYRFDAKGNLRSTTDPLGSSTQFKYDKLNRRKEAINALGESTKYEYDGVGNVTMVQRPDGNTLTLDYDPLSRLVAVQDVIGMVRTYAYDENSNVIAESDGLGNTGAFGFDALDRLVTLMDPVGGTSSFTYDANGNILSYTDRLGNVTSYTYGDAGRRLTETDAISAVKQYAYDANGNLVSVTDQNGNVTSYAYNANDQLLTETYADGSTRNFTYNAVRNPLTRTDNNGVTTNYVYDAADRLTARHYPGGVSDQLVYDAKGRMVQANNATVNISFTYDPLDRLLSEDMGGQVIGFAYDTPGRLRQVNYPGGRKIQELMDPRGRLVRITDITADAYVVAEQVFDAADRKTQRSYANGTNTQWTYNANSRITGIIHGPGPYASFNYGYDAEDNRLYEQRGHQPDQSYAYTYDDLLRLVGTAKGTLSGNTIPTPTGSETFNYDPLGNRITASLNGVSASYASNNLNQYTSYTSGGITDLSYDANGNLVQEGSRTFQYDHENRLIGVDGGSTGSYGFDALGRRVKKTVAGVVIWCYHNGINVIEEQNSTHATVKTHVFGNQVDEIIQMQQGSATYYYAHDALGSVVALTDQGGTLVEQYTYNAYGSVQISDEFGLPLAVSIASNQHLFTGRIWDNESGFYFSRYRTLSSTTGRFIQRDPIGYWDGLSAYQYGLSNPANMTDPLGLASNYPCPPKGASIREMLGLDNGMEEVQSILDLLSALATSKSNFFRNNDIWFESLKGRVHTPWSDWWNSGGVQRGRELAEKAGKKWNNTSKVLDIVSASITGANVSTTVDLGVGDYMEVALTVASLAASLGVVAAAAPIAATTVALASIAYTLYDVGVYIGSNGKYGASDVINSIFE